MSSTYRFSAPFMVRLLGVGLAGIGVFVVLLAVLVATFSLPTAVLTTGVLVAVVAVLVIGVFALRRGVVVRLDEAGYRVRLVRGAGVRRAGWKEVEDVVAATVAGERCIVLRLRDGRSTTIPVDVLAARTEDFVEDLREHLNRGHGYRRLRPRGA